MEWKRALNAYNYPFDLKKYTHSAARPGFFARSSISGNVADTMQFEAHFRENKRQVYAWAEVVYWKLYSMPMVRNGTTERIESYLSCRGTESILQACEKYIASPSLAGLKAIMTTLGIKSRSIAVSATFPALLCPEKIPMVDTRVARWVGSNMLDHTEADPMAPKLVRPRYLDKQANVLTLADYPFVKSWYEWCQYKAQILSAVTGIDWRPRDVEMAVFVAANDMSIVLESTI